MHKTTKTGIKNFSRCTRSWSVGCTLASYSDRWPRFKHKQKYRHPYYMYLQIHKHERICTGRQRYTHMHSFPGASGGCWETAAFSWSWSPHSVRPAGLSANPTHLCNREWRGWGVCRHLGCSWGAGVGKTCNGNRLPGRQVGILSST